MDSAQIASSLATRQLAEELEKRGMKSTGFPDDDARRLQVAFDAEYERDKAVNAAQHSATVAAKRLQARALRARRFLESLEVDEAESLTGDPRAGFLARVIAADATPASLTLRGLHVHAIRALVRALSSNTSLRELDLVGCDLSDLYAARALRSLLAANSALERLDLDTNALTSLGASEIAAGLAANKTLRALSLEDCPLTRASSEFPGEETDVELGGGGPRAADPRFADAGVLPEDESPRVLTGLHALCRAIAVHPALVSVSLFNCGLGPLGGRFVLDAARENPRLLRVQVSPTDGVALEDVAAIYEAVTANGTALAARAAAEAAAAETAKEKVDDREELRAALVETAYTAWSNAEADFRVALELDKQAADDAAEDLARHFRVQKMREAMELQKQKDGEKKKK